METGGVGLVMGGCSGCAAGVRVLDAHDCLGMSVRAG